MPGEPSSRNIVIAFVIVTVAIAIGAVLLLTTRPDAVQITINPPVPTVTPEPSATPAPIQVYVTGEVQNPQITVELPFESRVQAAIDAAGGFTENADLDRVNVAGVLRDGDQIHVPSIEDESVPVSVATPSGGSLINVNTATLEELQNLPGVGPALAERIIDYREEYGPFASIEDLDEVSGIGPSLLEGFAGLIEF